MSMTRSDLIEQQTGLPRVLAAMIEDFCTLTTFEGHDNLVRCLVISPDRQHMYSGSFDWTIRQWSLETGQVLRILQGHTSWVRCLAISSDNQYLYSGSTDKTVRQWYVGEEEESTMGQARGSGQLVRIFGGHNSSVEGLAISSNNKSLYSGSHTIQRWCTQTGQLLQTFKGHTQQIFCLAISSDNRYLYSGSGDHSIQQWDIDDEPLCSSLPIKQPHQSFQCHAGWVRTLVVSSDNRLLYSGCDDGIIREWCTQTGQLRRLLQGHSQETINLALSPDNHYLYSGAHDITIRKWNLEQHSNQTDVETAQSPTVLNCESVISSGRIALALVCTNRTLIYSHGNEIRQFLCRPVLDSSPCQV